MGKRKPTLPRRRSGANFVDLTIHRSTQAVARQNDSIGAGGTGSTAAMPSIPWPPAGVSSALPPAFPAISAAASASESTHSPTTMLVQPSSSVGVPPHLRVVGKPLVSTVPLVREASGGRDPPTPAAQEETVTMTVAELEAWKQRTIMQIEDHFTNEQLKRIAEFGRVHANLVKEAKEYVAGIEAQLKEQFERERESLKRQAEAYVAQFQQENQQLRQRVQELEDEFEEAQEEERVAQDAAVEESPLGPDMGTLNPPPNATTVKRAPVLGKRTSDRTSVTGSDDESSSPIQSPDPSSVESPNENASNNKVDAVAESMSRTIHIRTPQAPPPTTRTPRKARPLSPSPETTYDNSPVDTSDMTSRDPRKQNVEQSSETHTNTAGVDYL